MNAKPWYQSATMISLAVAIITKIFLLAGQPESEAGKQAAEFAPMLLGFIGILCDVIAMYGRKRAQGPVTMTSASAAAVNESAIASKQAGFIRVGLMIVLACCASALLSLPGCSGTRAAYQEAASHKAAATEDTAFVVVNHYASIVHEARVLRDEGKLVGAPLAAVQEAVTSANPYVLKLSSTMDKYRAIKDAKTQEELQAAVNDAVIALADVVRKLNDAKAVH